MTTMEERPFRQHKKPRICQRCRTHGDEQLSTSEHRLGCPYRDCQCPKCQTIQRENLRHSEYNRRRRAERREKAGYPNQFMQPSHLPLPSPQAASAAAAHPPYIVVVPENQQPMPSAPGHYMAPPHHHLHPPRTYPLPTASSTFMRNPRTIVTQPPTPTYHGQTSGSVPGMQNPPMGPTFYSGPPTHPPPPPQVTLGRPYSSGPITPSFRYGPSASLDRSSPPAKRLRKSSSAVDLEDSDSANGLPVKEPVRPPSEESTGNAVVEENGNNHSPFHSPAAHPPDSNASSEGDSSPIINPPGQPQTSPPPLQSNEQRQGTSDESPTYLESSEAHRDAVPARPTMLRTSGSLPWPVSDQTPVSAELLVQLLDQNPGVNHRVAFMYLVSCGGDIGKATQELQILKTGTQQQISPSSNSSQCSSECSSSEESEIEVDDVEDRHHRLAVRSKFGFRLGHAGETSERVDDSWSSTSSSPQSYPSPRGLRKKSQRQCSVCKCYFSVAQTNNTKFCGKHKL